MRHVQLSVLLAACDPSGATAPGLAPPPPADFALAVDAAVAGGSTTLRATGVAPGATVWFAHGTSGYGTYCPPAFGGSCLDILPPVKVFGSAVADASGHATLVFAIHPSTADRRYDVQAAIQAAPALVSNAVHVWSAPPGADVSDGADLDGDGSRRVDGDCDDGDADVAPFLPDTVGDGVDADCDGIDGSDHDGDGYLVASGGGDDCDDTRPAVHPGAIERCDLRDDDCDGQVDEGMPDVDGSGTPDCHEVAVVLTWGFQAHDVAFWTCDGQLPLARELVALEDALAAVGLTPVRVDEDQVAGVAASDLAPYAATILHNGGWGDALRSPTVDALLAYPERPLLFLGDDIGLVTRETAVVSGRPELYALTHIAAHVHNGNEAFKGLGALLVDPDHGVVNGPTGPVSSFAYAADLDHVELTGTGEQVLFTKDQVGVPVTWLIDEPARRSAVVMPCVYNTNVCPVSDPAGLEDIARLIANTLWWTLALD